MSTKNQRNNFNIGNSGTSGVKKQNNYDLSGISVEMKDKISIYGA